MTNRADEVYAAPGPFGQAAFHGGAGSFPECGAARTAPDTPPHYEEWIEIAGGANIGAILERLFGVHAALFDGVSASSEILKFYPQARIMGLQYQGKRFDF